MTNSITKELYLQLRDELTDKTSLPSKRQISLLVATKLVEFTETAYPAIGGNIQIRTNDKETYTEIGALLIYELQIITFNFRYFQSNTTILTKEIYNERFYKRAIHEIAIEK